MYARSGAIGKLGGWAACDRHSGLFCASTVDVASGSAPDFLLRAPAQSILLCAPSKQTSICVAYRKERPQPSRAHPPQSNRRTSGCFCGETLSKEGGDKGAESMENLFMPELPTKSDLRENFFIFFQIFFLESVVQTQRPSGVHLHRSGYLHCTFLPSLCCGRCKF